MHSIFLSNLAHPLRLCRTTEIHPRPSQTKARAMFAPCAGSCTSCSSCSSAWRPSTTRCAAAADAQRTAVVVSSLAGPTLIPATADASLGRAGADKRVLIETL
jgi:hypothetical protein